MQLHQTTIPRALNKAYRKEKVLREELDNFKAQLRTLLGRINTDESEENAKNHLRDFLNDTGYKDQHLIATKGRADLVIHSEKKASSPVSVLFEVKRPRGKDNPKSAEMVSRERMNAKALHELILYYLRERMEHGNTDLKYLVITDIHQWFVFDAADFDRLFYQNQRLRREYEAWRDGRKTQSTTDFFYRDIAQPFVEAMDDALPCVAFDLRDYEKALDKGPEQKLLPLFKLLSPTHLLRLPFANDSNSLDKTFYHELLHIIGLTESKEKNKKVIQRKPEGERNHGSLLENAITTLQTEDRLHKVPKPSQYGSTKDERLFNVALELAITWVNRILFLKLLEAQLLQYHDGDPAYRFLNSQTITDFDELNELFFEVLAKQKAERPDYVQRKYAHVPYLNSSLFEISELEDATLRINSLKDRFTLPLLPKTVLKDPQGKRRSGEAKVLNYFFDFLDAYDFSSEGSEDIQEENKTLINASVLGLIFEKINGYRDGSFFTPGFITMYMCRETLRRAVVQKFEASKAFPDYEGGSFEGLSHYMGRRYEPEDLQQGNALINDLKVCDPAVGSGHFLVSALNELITIKSELGLLLGRDGKPLPVRVEVENDELMVSWRHSDELFEYRPGVTESQRVQEALFHEKQTLIENCLFGVDINPNSVKICRLRLWIELLKNAYYKGGATSPEASSHKKGELETLPNIDINIKQGNSLVSRFDLDADLSKALRSIKYDINAYRGFVHDYHRATDKAEKRGLLQLIDSIKGDFRSEIGRNDPKVRRLHRLSEQLYQKYESGQLFEASLSAAQKKDKAKLVAQIDKLSGEIAAIKDAAIYENAFEWRFEFPEVLDEAGNYTGFDVVVGNPPYIRQEALGDIKPYLKENFETYAGTADLLVFFIEQGMKVLSKGGHFSYIISNKFMRANFGKALRQWMQQYRLLEIIDFGDLPVFEEATTYPCILSLAKEAPTGEFTAANVPELEREDFSGYLQSIQFTSLQTALGEEGWTLTDARTQQLLEKLRNTGVPLGEYVDGKIYYGIKTGLNEAFVIDEATKDRLIAENPKSAEVIKPFLIGKDLKHYGKPIAKQFLIFFPKGWSRSEFGDLSEASAFEFLRTKYSSVASYLEPFAAKAKKRYDKGEYWWELRACDYYPEFEKTKVLWPGISSEITAFAFDDLGQFGNDNNQMLITDAKALFGFLNSKASHFFLRNTCDFVRGGFARLKIAYVSNIPIPEITSQASAQLEKLVHQILHQKQQDPAADTTDLEAEIDLLVYRLYGLSWSEVKLVDPEFGMEEAAYEAVEI